jgi:hypothetical protein
MLAFAQGLDFMVMRGDGGHKFVLESEDRASTARGQALFHVLRSCADGGSMN